MSKQSTDRQVIKIVAEQTGWDWRKVTPETRICDDLAADSLDAIEIVMALECEFNCEISDVLAGQVKTVADAIALVKQSQ